jgi:predicted phosphodiesterase
MRILHVTDFHFNKRWFDWLAAEAPDCDLICHTGDFLDVFANVPVPVQIRQVSRWLARVRRPMVFCSGNHDVLLRHAPPGGCATAVSKTDGQDWGDFELGEDLRSGLLPAPDIVLSGHQHAPRSWHARCGAAVSFNPGFSAGSDVPNHIVLDLAARRRALWHVEGQPVGALDLPDAPDPAADDRIAARRRPRIAPGHPKHPCCEHEP